MDATEVTFTSRLIGGSKKGAITTFTSRFCAMWLTNQGNVRTVRLAIGSSETLAKIQNISCAGWEQTEQSVNQGFEKYKFGNDDPNIERTTDH